jgi:ribonuclease HII
MTRVAGVFPAYGFERHKGYATPEHLDCLTLHGPCRLHRQSFAPVRR